MLTKAYGILAGGGVKGAALVGGIQAIEQNKIEFVGYGGTSAGSIIALLASVGYTSEELEKIMIEEIDFTQFLDNSASELENLKDSFRQLFEKINNFNLNDEIWRMGENRRLIMTLINFLKRLNQDLGLCDANGLKQFLVEKIGEKHDSLKNKTDITFRELQEQGCYPLKVVASDLISRQAVIYPLDQGQGLDYSVIDAVRASMSFPFVFFPVQTDNYLLVDGGLSSNLPLFLFQEERKVNNYPVIALDLVVDDNNQSNHSLDQSNYGLLKFIPDMLETVLEASDNLIETLIKNIYYISIKLPKDIGTLDFEISKQDRERLFDRGYRDVSSYLNKNVFQAIKKVRTERERLRVLYGRIDLIEKTLEKVAISFKNYSNAEEIRAYIMLPTERNTLIVVYQYGMDNDPDIDWEVPVNSGSIGYTWVSRKHGRVNIEMMKNNLEDYNLTKTQVNKIRKDRQAIYSVPIFDLSLSRTEKIEDLEMLGILCIDTSTSLENTLWLNQDSVCKNEIELWADILALILK
ncbi:patatin-like phospholipase family protein [Cyanothece sp. BG0011]|uniref:patatin-like phospholipase family protein n=1 Tax=Cyanothece sp. BG0011 TaxID=2082950 RepID=UPI000D1EA25F|nr:patatin-like phospholipase family protein [Cyanothece sp. BG0011]